MKEGDIRSWPTFTSTSTLFSEAKKFANRQKPSEKAVYKIFLNGKNSPHLHIDTLSDEGCWSFFKGECEILLFPFFTF